MAKLFVICGHGDGDPGACGNGYQEAERVRTLAKHIKKFGGDSVKVGDTSKNWYKSKLVNKKNIPSGSLVLELHMDSAAKSAKGAHIIIKAGMDADKYDKALANYLAKEFPGRANKIVKRSDLANINRAATAGINYRLAECGFITNAEDAKKFNSEMDEIAKGILQCFGITATSSITNESNTSGSASTATSVYYKKYTGKSEAVDTVLKAIGAPEKYRGSWVKRKPVAAANGINSYTGTAVQNNKLISLAKCGKLKKV